MDYMETLRIAEEELRKQEPELLISHIAERYARHTARGRTDSPAEYIAFSIMHITSCYADAIKRARGGWTCGTHANRVRSLLSRKIASRYDDEQLMRFIHFCVRCADGQESLRNADRITKAMTVDFLTLRPKPLVHPPHSWWLQALKEEPEEN